MNPIALTPNGDFVLVDGKLSTTTNGPLQNFISESRCLQGTYSVDQNFGRNAYVWGLSQSPNDRCADLIRIGQQYLVVQAITYLPESKSYEIYT